ncbi:ABC transporter substrate-binding protein [Glycomyces sp. TRM65418]|uniref:ABC transporter substrate-binding protein n=1 Tax=Glycomyces sp. TRM65418 TaxID=2867006 RepID=UPI001CE6248E|nr:ABC transporter substrate-binding protein [Glycomyces sp. TRM65418]MCC3761654.1 ABC transporter substrate-binding protein [Glycomyces sp. TRM65418]QZD55748.1 ABC transporter substrate-binding protein [Glycomyces sp. TRM65418]
MSEQATSADTDAPADGPLSLPPSPGSFLWAKRRRRLRRFAILTTVAVVAVAAVVFGPRLWADLRCGGLGSGVRELGGECVGVTDGSFVFQDQFTRIQEDIKAENDWAARQAAAEGLPLVRIALLTTLTTTEDSAMSADKIQSALEGAYVALHRANRTQELGDRLRYVQLVLANEGARQTHWEYTVGRLEDMVDDDVPLVAVMGQGVSSDNTVAAAERLSAAGIPMVTGVTTADGIDHDAIDGLIRTAPSNTDFAVALRRYLDARGDIASAVLVYDSTAQDRYTTTLRTAYEAELADYIAGSHQPFPGRSIQSGGPEVFDPITRNICAAETEAVLFAGREPDLKVFLEALSVRACLDRPLTVLFGVTGTDMQREREIAEWVDAGRLEVFYAAGADPGWATGATPAPEWFAAFHEDYTTLVDRDPHSLADGYAMTYHDALATAILAVRITNPWEVAAPLPVDVREHLLLLNSEQVVRGATGTLSFASNRGGNPGGKWVPVVPLPYPANPAELPDLDTYVTPAE